MIGFHCNVDHLGMSDIVSGGLQSSNPPPSENVLTEKKKVTWLWNMML